MDAAKGVRAAWVALEDSMQQTLTTGAFGSFSPIGKIELVVGGAASSLGSIISAVQGGAQVVVVSQTGGAADAIALALRTLEDEDGRFNSKWLRRQSGMGAYKFFFQPGVGPSECVRVSKTETPGLLGSSGTSLSVVEC